MAGLPEVTLAGSLTADPELRTTPQGNALAVFTVAANDRRYDRDTGRWVDGEATFLRCITWGGEAHNVVASLKRGQRVLLTGRLKQRTYQSSAGDKRSVIELETTEVAASLKWATATVTKPTPTSRRNPDPSPTSPAAPTPPVDDEPLF